MFDTFVDKSSACASTIEKEEALNMQYFRELLQKIHPENLTEDDIDSGEVALHSAAGVVTWSAFEKWHTPYFEVVDMHPDIVARCPCNRKNKGNRKWTREPKLRLCHGTRWLCTGKQTQYGSSRKFLGNVNFH